MKVKERQTAVLEHTVFISCIIPVFNEAENIGELLTSLYNILQETTSHFEIIVIDDGSSDNTMERILALPKHYGIKFLGLSRNFGKEIALTAGLEHCEGDVVILLDGDFQHPVTIIPEFLKYWADGYDMVYGMRKDRQDQSYLNRNFSRLFYWLMKKITDIDLPNNAGDFRLMDKNVVLALKEFPERTRFMKGLYAWVGYKKIGIPFIVNERAAGKSTWGFARLIELAITGITSFSDVPLRVWSLIGFAISFVSLIYAIYIVTVTLIFGADLPGFPTLIVAIMFLGGIQILSVGILGEYIARIFTEVKQRPKYLIQVKKGFND